MLTKLGFRVMVSGRSNHDLFETGMESIPSENICYPAKLVHGHIRDLVKKKVDRIFMPSIAAIGSENTESTSESMCAVVKGISACDPQLGFSGETVGHSV